MNKKYRVVNLMCWDDSIEEENVCCMSLSDEYTKLECERSDVWVDSNQYIGKARYYEIDIKELVKYVYSKENVDIFCKNNPECYGLTFNIYNDEYDLDNYIIKYIPNNRYKKIKKIKSKLNVQ